MELKSWKNNVHPLKDLVLRRIAIQKWDRPDMYICAAQWNSIELKSYPNELTIDHFSSLIDNLRLPKSIKTELVSVIKGVYREFTKWLNFHKEFLELKETNDLLSLQTLKHIIWTSVGTINYKKTAELLIRHRKLDVVNRYKLASLYCFYLDVQNLYAQLSVESRVHYDRLSERFRFPSNIVWFWTSHNDLFLYARQDSQEFLSKCEYAFKLSAREGFRSATEYFFEKLTEAQKRKTLVETAELVVYKCLSTDLSYISQNLQFSDILCYLLSVMEGYELKNILKNHSLIILKGLLHWTRLDIFTKLSELAFPYFTKSEFSDLVYFLYKNIAAGYNYLQLVLGLLDNRPKNFSNSAVLQLTHLLEYYSKIGDIKSLCFILKYLDPKERVLVVLSDNGIRNIHYLVKQGKWDVIKPYLRKAELPIGDRRELLKQVWFLKPKLTPKTYKRFKNLVNKIVAPLPSCKKPTCSRTYRKAV